MKDFGDRLIEQVNTMHRHIIDDAPPCLIVIEGENRIVKKVICGDSQVETFWNPKTYEEVFPDPTPTLPPRYSDDGIERPANLPVLTFPIFRESKEVSNIIPPRDSKDSTDEPI